MSDGEDNPDQDVESADGRAARLFRRLTVNEWLTLVVAFSGLAVSVRSCSISEDNSDLENAVGEIAGVAIQTKRSADAIENQMVVLGQGLEESRKQTRLIAIQTGALSDTAKADSTLAGIATAGQLVTIGLSKAEFTFIADPYAIKKSWTVSGKWTFASPGSPGYVVTKQTLYYYWGYTLPSRPTVKEESDASELIVAPGEGFQVIEPVINDISRENYAKIMANGFFYFYGRIDFRDRFGKSHFQCVAYKIAISNSGKSAGFAEAGGPIYHCAG